jgi:hypothetical protein
MLPACRIVVVKTHSRKTKMKPQLWFYQRISAQICGEKFTRILALLPDPAGPL